MNVSLQYKPVNERLRQLGGSAKLVLDILEYDPAYERVFLAICGSESPLRNAQLQAVLNAWNWQHRAAVHSPLAHDRCCGVPLTLCCHCEQEHAGVRHPG